MISRSVPFFWAPALRLPFHHTCSSLLRFRSWDGPSDPLCLPRGRKRKGPVLAVASPRLLRWATGSAPQRRLSPAARTVPAQIPARGGPELHARVHPALQPLHGWPAERLPAAHESCLAPSLLCSLGCRDPQHCHPTRATLPSVRDRCSVVLLPAGSREKNLKSIPIAGCLLDHTRSSQNHHTLTGYFCARVRERGPLRTDLGLGIQKKKKSLPCENLSPAHGDSANVSYCCYS